MANLVLFGDSYCAEYDNTISQETWWKRVASNLELGIKNYAVRGSSLNYSTVKYYEYLNGSYSVDDIIIFTITSSGRSPLVHPDFPPSSSAIMQLFSTRGFSLDKIPFPDMVKNHYIDHKDFYKTWFQFYNPDLHLSQVNLIREALHGLKNKKLLINAFDEAKASDFTRLYDFHLDGCITEISNKEFASLNDGYPMRRMVDERANHLSPENHDIFAEYILKCLDGDIKSMLHVDFKQGFLNV